MKNQEAIEEADYVLDIIKPYKITYPVVIDFEKKYAPILILFFIASFANVSNEESVFRIPLP